MSKSVLRRSAAAATLRLLFPALALVAIGPALPIASACVSAQAVGDKGGAKDADAAKGNALTPPARVDARQTGSRAVTVVWNHVPGAVSYVVTRQSGRSGWRRVHPPNASDTSFVDWNVPPNEATMYQVAGVDRRDLVGPKTMSRSVTLKDDGGTADGADGAGAGTGAGSPGLPTAGEGGMTSVLVSLGAHVSLRRGEDTELHASAGARWLSLDPGILRVTDAGRVTGTDVGRGQILAISRDATSAVRVTVFTIDIDR
ncbi:MAG TPA: fibronectin type III domain-containing protein [Gemmatimonadaceae bacterium]